MDDQEFVVKRAAAALNWRTAINIQNDPHGAGENLEAWISWKDRLVAERGRLDRLLAELRGAVPAKASGENFRTAPDATAILDSIEEFNRKVLRLRQQAMLLLELESKSPV